MYHFNRGEVSKIAFVWHWQGRLVSWVQGLEGSLFLQYSDGKEITIAYQTLIEYGWVKDSIPLVYLPISNRCLMTSENECSIDCSDCQFNRGEGNE
jgi:hypothetical protein